MSETLLSASQVRLRSDMVREQESRKAEAMKSATDIVNALVESGGVIILVPYELDKYVIALLEGSEFSITVLRQPKRYGFLWLKTRAQPKAATIVSAYVHNGPGVVWFSVDFETMQAKVEFRRKCVFG